MKNKKFIIFILLILMVLSIGSSNASKEGRVKSRGGITSHITRLEGANRIQTSVEIAKAQYKDSKPDAVVIATGYDFPDALSGGGLAYKYNAPLLLVGRTVNDSRATLNYIINNLGKTKTIYALGGESVVSKDIVNYLCSKGYKVRRISGNSRYETNQKIADSLNVSKYTPIVIVNSQGFADALSISSIASIKGYPILLSRKDSLTANVSNDINVIQPTTVYIIGGEKVLSPNIEKQIREIKNDVNIVRIGGKDRYETSMKIVKQFNLKTDTITLACGSNFPDALSGSVLAARKNSNILLINDKNIDKQIQLLASIDNMVVLGGKAVINDSVFTIDNYSSTKNKPETILEWSKARHTLGHYDEASNGYKAVIANPASSEALKLKAQAYLTLSSSHYPLQPVQTTQYLEASIAKRDEYKANGYVYIDNISYKTTGDYLEASKETCYYEQPNIIHIDKNGLPMVMYDLDKGGDGKYHYNPVTIAQFCLCTFGKYMTGTGTKEQFLAAANKLKELQSSSGAMRLDFPFQHYTNNVPFKPGWVSSLAQGQAISVFVRAYQVTGNKAYLDAANKAYTFMCLPVSAGGTKDTLNKLDGTNNVFFQEYVTTPKCYTLNGYIFTMIGIYDLSQTKDSKYAKDAAEMFKACQNSLLRIAYKYDLGHMTVYDATYITKPGQYPNMNIGYHGVHIELMGAMYSITKNPIYKYYNLMWKSYTKE